MTPQEVVAWVRENYDAEAIGAARLGGGPYSEVWRVDGAPMTVLKMFTDRSVENPAFELTMERARYEAAALQLLEHDDELRALGTRWVVTPSFVHADFRAGMLAMTHLDHQTDIGVGLVQGDVDEHQVSRLGTWLGVLHRQTRHRMDLLRRFKNIGVQRTRLRVRYATVETVLRDADVPIPPDRLREAGRRALALGRSLIQPGECLVMGDLGPNSVLAMGDRLGVIDWEFAHFGRPLQDVAHFAAHLWLIADTCEDRLGSVRLHNARGAFLEAYFRAAFVWDEDEHAAAAIHAGCEIITRTFGALHDDSLYPDIGARQAAAARAIDAILGDWSPLHA